MLNGGRWLWLVVALALLVPASAAGAVDGSAAGAVFIGDQFRTRLQHPTRLNLWASDALAGLRWSSWGRSVTTASGAISTHERGRYRYLPSRVRASRRRGCRGRTVYTRLSYTDLQGRWTHARFWADSCSFSA